MSLGQSSSGGTSWRWYQSRQADMWINKQKGSGILCTFISYLLNILLLVFCIILHCIIIICQIFNWEASCYQGLQKSKASALKEYFHFYFSLLPHEIILHYCFCTYGIFYLWDSEQACIPLCSDWLRDSPKVKYADDFIRHVKYVQTRRRWSKTNITRWQTD